MRAARVGCAALHQASAAQCSHPLRQFLRRNAGFCTQLLRKYRHAQLFQIPTQRLPLLAVLQTARGGLFHCIHERFELEHARLVARRIALCAFGAQDHRPEVARIIGQCVGRGVAQEACMHQRAQLLLHVIQIAACPAHQRCFQQWLEFGHGAQDAFGQLQALHRFAEQSLARIVSALRKCAGVANGAQAIGQHGVERRIDQIATQAFL